MGQQDSTGVSVQKDEKTLIEEDDARMISETLHNQLDRKVLRHLLGSTQPKAYFQLKYSANLSHELSLWKTLWEMGIELSINDIREHFGINPPANASDCLKKKDK